MFHGTFKSPSQCDVPVIRAIHKNMQTVAYRFDAGIDSCFKEIIEFFKENEDLVDYLYDNGTRKTSRTYRAKWEPGFRNAALAG